MRVAALDIGTNTALVLVVDRRDDGSLVVVHERAVVTRLGEGVDRTHRFAPEAVARTKSCLDEFAALLRALCPDHVAVVGTSAMRDAAGGEELADHVRASFGVTVRIVSGDEEARLTFRGALGGLPAAAADTDVAVFDIGGGSTEVVFGRTGSAAPILSYSASFAIGSVRLTERHVTHDPPTKAECDAIARAASEAFDTVPPLPNDRPPIGIAGTVTTLAAVSLGLEPYDGALVHGRRLRRDELRRVVDDLASRNLDSRRRLPGMEPKRADVIVAGGRIALSLLDHWNAADIVVSDRGVRWGLAAEMIAGALRK